MPVFCLCLARDARYCKAQFCNRMSSVYVCVRPSVTFVDQDHIGCKSTSGVGKGTNFKFCTHSHGIDRNKSSLKMSAKLAVRTPKNFQSTHIGYRAHRAVIFAIAWHLVTGYRGNDRESNVCVALK